MEKLSFFEKICSMVEKTLFRRTPQLYRRLYSIYKAITDRSERRLCRSLIQPGMIVADIGANIGLYTDFFAKCVGPKGQVHAFEPEPTNFQLLSRSLGSRKNITLNQMAVGNKTEQSYLYISPNLNVDHQTYNSHSDRQKITITTTTLDDYFPSNQSVDFIKLDIQGFEYHALLGMDRVLSKNSQVKIILEYSPAGLASAGANNQQLKSFLKERGFALYHILHDGSLSLLNDKEPPLNALGYTNLFAQRNDL